MSLLKLFPTTILVLCLGFSSTANAQKIYESNNGQVPVIVSSPGSLVFIGKDKTPIRVRFWKKVKGENKKDVYLNDMDGNGDIDVVGTGKPLFVLNSQGNPIASYKSGCSQSLVADFTGDYKHEIACLDGKTLSLFTHDLKPIWSKDTKRFSICHAGDVNADQTIDIECKHGRMWTRFEGKSGKQLGASSTSKISAPVIPGIAPANPDVLDGKRMFDLNSDYILEESLVKKGNSVIVQSVPTKKILGIIKLKSPPITALVKDLNGDTKLDIIVVTKKEIVIASPDGKSKSFPLNARNYKSKAIVNLVHISSTGFINTAEIAKKVVRSHNEKLSLCYENLIYKNQFAKVENMFIEVVVNPKGKVMYLTTNKLSSSEEKVRGCIQKVLKKLDFPKPVDETGKLQISIAFELEYKASK